MPREIEAVKQSGKAAGPLRSVGSREGGERGAQGEGDLAIGEFEEEDQTADNGCGFVLGGGDCSRSPLT